MAKANKEPDIKDEEMQEQAPEEKISKKEKPPKEKKERVKAEGGGRGAKAFIVLFVIAVIGLAVAIIGFNAFNIRDKYLADTLRKVPIVNNLLPPPPIEGEGEGEDGEMIPETTPEEYQEQIDQARKELADALAQIEAHLATIDRNNIEIARLRSIEAQHEQFREEKREFDERIINGDPAAFASYFESIDPETAEALYPRARDDTERQERIDNFLAAISQTDESSAAKMLEQLIPGDLDLVVEILKGLSNRTAGEILSKMSAENAAAVTKRWDPIRY